MSYAISIGSLTIFGPSVKSHDLPACTCKEAQKACRPTYVFSIPGQIKFRIALSHLADCPQKSCQKFYAKVIRGAKLKLRWLQQEDVCLGCGTAQSKLKNETALLSHLSRCPDESCAQLRRALLLTIREKLAPVVVPVATEQFG